MTHHFKLLVFITTIFCVYSCPLDSLAQSDNLCETESCHFTGFGNNSRLLWIPGLPGPGSINYNTTEESLSFDKFNNGECHIYGEIYNHTHPDYGFYIDVWFTARMEWPEWNSLGRGWKGDEPIVQDHYEDWDYYIVDESKTNSLTGIGEYEGSYITLTHKPASYLYGLQVGTAANDQNAEPGLSCWFFYDGEALGQNVSGNCDINGEGTCTQEEVMQCLADVGLLCGEELSLENTGIPVISCPGYTLSYSDSYISDCPVVIIREWTATNSDGDEVTCIQQITAPDLTAPEFSEEIENSVVSIFPEIDSSVISAIDNCSNTTIEIVIAELGTGTEECGQFRTQTPGGWGSPANGNNPGVFRDANFDLTFPNGLMIGCETTLKLNSPSDVENFLPSGGTPSVLMENLVNPNGYGNTLAGHLVAISLTLGFDELFQDFGESDQLLKNQILLSGTFNGWSIEDVVNLANDVFGGCNSQYSPSEMTEALSTINENYVDGEIDNGNVLCVDSSVECSETYVVSYIASDECNNSTIENQIIVVQSGDEFTASDCPEDISVECESIPEAPSLEFTSLCGNILTAVLTEEILTGECSGNYTIVRTWSVTNDLGEVFECSQQVLVEDNSPPVLLNIPEDLTVSCGEIPPVTIEAEDNCSSEDVTIQIVETELSGNCFPVLQRTFIAEDNCGNIATHIQYITVVDNESPEVLNAPLDLELECGADIPHYTPVVIDNCSEELFVELAENETSLSCGYQLEQVWIVSDACNNSTSISRTIVFTDSTAPYLLQDLEQLFLECDEELIIPQFSDNCQEELTIEVIEPSLSSCNEGGEIMYLVTDNCGNSSEFSQLVTRTDNTAPIFLELETEIEIECGEQASVPNPQVIDCAEVSISYTDMALPSEGCAELVRTWIAEDECGNVSVAAQNIILVDTQAPVFFTTLEDLETSCVDLPEPVNPAVTDSCDDDLELTFTEELLPLECGAELTRVWEAEDNCGNISQLVQVITIVDEEAPMITGSTELVVSCDATIEDLIQIEDDCSEYLELTFVDESIANSDCENIVSRVYTAVDLCSNSSSFTQIITFRDEEAPVFPSLNTIHLECESELGTIEFPYVTDNCSAVQILFADDSNFIDCNTRITRTWTAIDACGNESQAIQFIDVEDTTPPVFSNIPENENLTCGSETPSFSAPTAVDNCSSVQIDFNEVTVNSSCTQSYNILRTWTATDECGNSANVTQQVSIMDEEAPVFNEEIADVTASCGDDLTPPVVTASDECGGSVNIEFEQNYASGGCPNIFRTWTATDECGNSTVMTQTVFIEDNEPPLMTGIVFTLEATCENIPDLPIPFVTDNCDENVDVTVSESVNGNGCEQLLIRTWIATDDCGNTTIAMQSISLIDEAPPVFLNPIADNAVECGQLNELPLPEVSDNCGGEINISFSDQPISEGCDAEILRTYIATDLCGNAATLTQTIHIIDLSPPVFTGVLAGTFVDCGSIPPATTPVISDACNAADIDVVYSQQTLGAGCSYTILRRWVATDACGNQAVAQRYIFVEDVEPPTLSDYPADIQLTCGSVLPEEAVLTASDNCTASPAVTFSEFTEENECGSVTTRSWSSADECGNELTHTQLIHISDVEAPVLLSIPADLTTDCMNIPGIGVTETTDNCDSDVEVYIEDEIVLGACPYLILRTYSAVDNCGNETSLIQTITVTDEIAPVFDFIPVNFSVSCSDLPEPFEMTASDNCTQEVQVEYSEQMNGLGCLRQLSRTWVAEDLCGNITSHTQLITLEDTSSPVAGDFEPELFYECSENLDLPNVEFFDDCSELIIIYDEERISSECSVTYDLFRNWTATDMCGNTKSVEQIVHVIDSKEPELNVTEDEITVNCDEIPEIPTLAVFGECGDFETEFTEDVHYLEELENTCKLGNAESLSGDVAIWLPSLSSDGSDYVFGQEAGMFTSENAEGNIHISGQVYNSANPNQSWILDFTLYDKQDWTDWSANGGRYKDDLGLAGDNYLDWDYYKLSSDSRLIGAGEFEGSELNLTHTPVDYTFGFQVGRGANNKNLDYGISGWFFYEGDLNGDYVFGSGDLIAEIKCCPDHDILRTWTATDCTGNSTVVTQIIHVREELALADMQINQFSVVEFDVLNTIGEDFIISFDSEDDNTKVLTMTDLAGKIVHQVTYSGLEKNTRYTRKIPKNEYLNGMYVFYLKGEKKVDSDKELNIK